MTSKLATAFFVAAVFAARAEAEDLAPSGAVRPLAKAGTLSVSIEEVRGLAKTMGDRGSYWDSEDNVREFIVNVLVDKAILAEAERQGLVDAEIERQVAEYRRRLIRQRFMAKIEKKEVTDDEIRRYYKEHPSEFAGQGEVKARHILFKMDASTPLARQQEIRSTAAAVAERARKGEDFAALARDYSEDPGTKYAGGVLAFSPRGRYPKVLDEVLFSDMPTGKIVGPIETQFGLHVVEVMERKTTEPVAFEKAREQIARRLAPQADRAAYARAIDQLKAKYPIRIDPEALADLRHYLSK